MQAIVDHLISLGSKSPATVVLVVSDRAHAGALERARTANIDAVLLRHAREPESNEILDLLVERRVDYVALAGYLRLIPASVVDRFTDRMINVHPALLPLYGGAGMYGMKVHQAVVEGAEKITGATVHMVTREYDRGAVLAQWPVRVLPGDDAHAVATRVLDVEHTLYPRTLVALIAGRRELFPIRPPDEYFAHPPISPEVVKRDIIAAFPPATSS
jgi:phosphoribosylglycinamide formyltransferase 1